MISFVIASLLLVGKYENPTKQYPSLSGASGNLRSISAIPNIPTTFGASFIANFFSQEPFINDPVSGQALKNSRNQFRFSGNYTFNFFLPVEFFAGATLSYSDNSSSSRASTLTTFFENTDLGARISFPVVPKIVYVGTFGFVRFFSGTRAPRNVSAAVYPPRSGPFVSGQLGVNESLDFNSLSESFPLRQHLQIAYRAPNGKISETDQEFNRFALDVYKYHALVGTFGLEVPYKYVTPIVEYSFEYNLTKANDNVKFSDNRQKASFGARFTPFASFGILAVVDKGIKGPAAGRVVGIARNPDWDFYVGLTFQALGESLFGNIGSLRGIVSDPKGIALENVSITLSDISSENSVTEPSGAYEFPRIKNGTYTLRAEKEGYEAQTRTIVIRDGSDSLADITMPLAGPKTGGLEVRAVDLQNQSPLKGVAIRVLGMPTAFATDDNGEATISEIAEGSKEITAELDGYEPSTAIVTIAPSETTTQVLQLEKKVIPMGFCAGIVTNAQGTPLTAVITSENGAVSPFGTDPLTGAFSQSLPPGSYELKVQAENYLPQTITCVVEPSSKYELQILLEKPKEATLVGDKIILPDAIYFDFGKSSIKAESHEVLDQVARILIEEKNYQTLKVEGHTDDVGSEEYNQNLSEARAKSVKRYLSRKGVASAKIEALGFGELQPASTNLTPEGRSENRRVEFNLVRE